jgi:Asp-tRNA(Asn)/Glu-tRNA(Gln) amidotransferase A subunit family amidase
VPPQSQYQPQHLAAFQGLISDLTSLGANVIDFPGLDMSLTTGTAGVPPGGVAPPNPYYSSPTVLATVDGSSVSPSGAIVDANQWDFSYAAGPEAFANSGVPTAAAISTLIGNYGRRGSGDPASTFNGAERLEGGIPVAARAQAVRLRNQLIANYTLALEEYDVDFMLIMQVAGVVGLRAGQGGGFGVSRKYYQVNNVLGWPTVSFPIGFSSAPNPVLPISAQFWGKRFSEPMLVQAMVDFQANFPTYHTAIPPDPTPVPFAQRVPAAVAAQSDQNAPSNDILVQEARILAGAA